MPAPERIDPVRGTWRRVLRSRYGKRVRKAIRMRRMAWVRARREGRRFQDPDARRSFFLYEAGLYTPLLGVESDLGLLCVSPYDYGQSQRIFVNRRIKYGPLARALEIAHSCGQDPTGDGKLFLDVGANIGIVTLTALKKFGFSSAVSIEAEPGNFRLLVANVTLNRGEAEVRTFNLAASSGSGEAPLRVSPGSHGEHKLVAEAATGEDPDIVTVPTRALDEILAEAGHQPGDVGFLKIDTEGHEPQVLDGARAVLSAGPPTMIEYAPFRYVDPEYGSERLEQIVAEYYTHFFDLRDAADDEAELRPILELADLRTEHALAAKRLGAKPKITDLLLIRR